MPPNALPRPFAPSTGDATIWLFIDYYQMVTSPPPESSSARDQGEM
jgi:hypothetical protein